MPVPLFTSSTQTLFAQERSWESQAHLSALLHLPVVLVHAPGPALEATLASHAAATGRPATAAQRSGHMAGTAAEAAALTQAPWGGAAWPRAPMASPFALHPATAEAVTAGIGAGESQNACIHPATLSLAHIQTSTQSP